MFDKKNVILEPRKVNEDVLIQVSDQTCSSGGSKINACEVCTEKQVDVSPKLPHKYSRWIVKKKASCTESGNSQRKCLVCGEIESKELPATGHKWETDPNNPTYTFCRQCGISNTETRFRQNGNNVQETPSFFNNNYYEKNRFTEKTTSVTQDWEMFILCLLFGIFGVHKFIENKKGYGFLYLFTCGLFYWGWIIDCIEYYKIAKSNSSANHSSKTEYREVISFSEILRNAFCYWKSFFTKQTTRMQKIKHWLGCSLTLVFIFMFGIATIPQYRNNPTSTEPIEIQPYWILILLANLILLFCAYSAGEKEKKTYFKQVIPYPTPVSPRIGMRIVSNFLLVIASFFLSMTYSTNPDDRYAGAMMGSVLMIWCAITMIYAHCPKECRKIRFTRTSAPASKISIACIGIVLTIMSIIVIGIGVGSNVQAQKYELMISYRESGENAEAYILSKELAGYENADNIADALYSLVLKDAEKLYLAGEASEAAALLKRCDIEENYEAYLCVANGEYKKSKLSNIVIPNGTTTIDKNAFKNYSMLTSVTIPSSVTTIGDQAFYGCNNLVYINYCGTEVQWLEITKGSKWDYYSPSWNKYEKMSYTMIFNYRN